MNIVQTIFYWIGFAVVVVWISSAVIFLLSSLMGWLMRKKNVWSDGNQKQGPWWG